MSETLQVSTPQAAYEWAQRYFAGQDCFRIMGEGLDSPSWHLVTSGRFCVLTMPKRWGVR